jgi:hypothetical protein
MGPHSRRDFLADVGRGMLVASLGPAMAADLGLTPGLFAADDSDRITFGKLEPLVDLMEDTPADKLLPEVVKKLNDGTDLRTIVAAAALANARAFGGRHYEGFHTFMALAPAYEMSKGMSEARRPLPVLKVLYRNATHIQAKGGRKKEVLHPVKPTPVPEGRVPGEVLRDATRRKDTAAAEGTFAAIAQGPPATAFDQLQYVVHDDANVHRVVLAWRAWATLDFTGPEHAHTLLRQSVQFCTRNSDVAGSHPHIAAVLTKLLDRYKLVGREFGQRQADDAWVESMSRVIYASGSEKAADAVAAAQADGFSPEPIGEAISLAANRLLLCDPGRTDDDGPKYKGSVHGDSVGVHASDAANAWRNIARVSGQRNAVASLIVGAYHVAGEYEGKNDPYPQAAHRERVKTADPAALLRETEAAIKNRDQAFAAALVARYGELGQPAGPVFDLMLKYGVSEDGALHAEKYYRTVMEEFASSRPAFRWRQLVGLARVTASEFGNPAPGYDQALRLLGG